MARRTRIFYAYPSSPPDIGETIESAVSALKNRPDFSKLGIRFRLWPDMRSSGKRLAQDVIDNIDRAHIFACDLTYPNDNVSFELGYAIARFKRVFVGVNPSIEGAERRFKRNYYDLLGLAYASYLNHKDLSDELVEAQPWSDLDSSLLNDRYRTPLARPEHPTLLYIRPAVDTYGVLQTEEFLRDSLFKNALMVDDPRENPSPSLDWYADQLVKADAVIVHLLSSEHQGSAAYNHRASLIAGLSRGLKRPLRIVAHEPYDPPIDYGSLLQVHDSAATCESIIRLWVETVSTDLPRRRPRRSESGSPIGLDLRSLTLGQPVAEHESEVLDSYFVETHPFYRALDGPATILIGRRGTGKTAILYGIRARLERENRNHVTVVNPVGYELQGLIRLLDEITQHSERGFLIESLWKYLIYSEIAESVARWIYDLPIYQSRTDEQTDFLKFFESNDEVLQRPFSERLRIAVGSLEGVGAIVDAVQQRIRISEKLHETLLRDLRRHISRALESRHKLAILIDNLDKPWSPGVNVDQLSELIAGLLNVIQDIPRDFGRASHGLTPLDAQVTVLLRSDIFSFIQSRIHEQDKLPIERVIWDDKALLLRVLDQRLVLNAPATLDSEFVWEKIFPDTVVGVPSREFILRSALPRPRDVIYLARRAMNNAIDRGHDVVSLDDLLDAREQYSEFVFRSVLAEDDPQRDKLEAVLYEFAGADSTVSLTDIRRFMLDAGVGASDIDYYVNLLCDIGFLGIQTANGFRYSREESQRLLLRGVSRRLAARQHADEIFQINPAFYQALQIED